MDFPNGFLFGSQLLDTLCIHFTAAICSFEALHSMATLSVPMWMNFLRTKAMMAAAVSTLVEEHLCPGRLAHCFRPPSSLAQ